MIAALLAYSFRWSIIPDSIGELGHGVKVTLELSVLSALFRSCSDSSSRSAGCPVPALRYLAYVYIQVFRALSLYIYVLWIYFGIAAGGRDQPAPLTGRA